MSELTKKLFELSEEDLANLYKEVFGAESGRLVLEDLRNRCFVKTSTVNAYPFDAGRTATNEGMRTVVLHIDNQINYEPVKEEPVNE